MGTNEMAERASKEMDEQWAMNVKPVSYQPTKAYYLDVGGVFYVRSIINDTAHAHVLPMYSYVIHVAPWERIMCLHEVHKVYMWAVSLGPLSH